MSIKRSMNKVSTNFENLSGSSPRSSENIYKSASNITKNAQSLFSPKKSSSSRLLSEPVETLSKAASNISQSVSSALPNLSSTSSSPSSPSSPSSLLNTNQVTSSSGISFWKYLVIFLILIFMGVTFFLFLFKPSNKDITHLYDPLLNYFNTNFNTNFKIDGKKQGEKTEKVSKKKNEVAVHKLEKVLNEKKVINNIDNKDNKDRTINNKQNQETDLLPKPVKKYKKLPVIPEADESTSRIQMNPTSKSGFCYIGEDRGFRSCIEVGEGDVCMSGDIFPTESICINPNLRE